MSERIWVYTFGLCHASVCAPKDMEGEEVALQAGLQQPTGLDHGWQVSEKPFKDGQTNPCECNDDPERRHWLLVC